MNVMFIVAKNQFGVDKLKAKFSVEFKTKNMDKAKQILGMGTARDIKTEALVELNKVY
jgi:hypothetical protein